MTFDKSFTLDQMMKDAQAQMTKTGERLNAIDATLNDRLGGRSRLGMLGAVIVSVAWGAAFLFAYCYFNAYIPEPFGLPLLGVSLALVVFVIIGDFVHLKYYGTILNAQERLTQLRSRVEMGQSGLPGNLRAFMDRRNAQWEMPLEAGSSINQEANQIEAQLAGMETLSSGLIAKIKDFLYYVTCIAWAGVGSYALFDYVASFDFLDFEYDTVHTIMIIAMVVACIIEILIAKMIWGMTNCEVGNVTLFATAVGPLIFVALILLVALVIVVVQIVLYIAGIAIAAICLFGSICGG